MCNVFLRRGGELEAGVSLLALQPAAGPGPWLHVAAGPMDSKGHSQSAVVVLAIRQEATDGMEGR